MVGVPQYRQVGPVDTCFSKEDLLKPRRMVVTSHSLSSSLYLLGALLIGFYDLVRCSWSSNEGV